jgi:hypothetical protein
MNANIYDVNKYTDNELYSILDLVNPSDRELEAKIYFMINKYKNMQNDSGDKLAKFFNDIYLRFFEVLDENSDEKIIEKIDNMDKPTNDAKSEQIVTTQEYSTSALNPLLKQTITRIISIDSQYRDAKKTTLSTNFSFNLSETLHNVLAVRLNSIQIPKTWYTISKSYGANFFYLKGNTEGINDGNHDYKIEIPVGNYTSQQLIDTINNSITTIKKNYSDACFGNTGFSYNINTCKATFSIDYTKIYDETSFAISFPNFTYPIDVAYTRNYTSLPQILGFDASFVPINFFTSNYFSNNSISDQYYINNDNNYFTIINYNGYDSSNGEFINATQNYKRALELCYNKIIIKPSFFTLKPDMSYNRDYVIQVFNEVLQKNSDLNGAYISKINVTDPSMVGYNKYYYKFVIPLNHFTITNAENMKTAVIFPQDKLWIGGNSLFQIDTSINEISAVKSNTSTNISDYIIGSNVYFTLKCNVPGYSDNSYNNTSSNNVRINLRPNRYNLTTYIGEINNNINTASGLYNNFFNGDTNSNISNFTINNLTDNFLRMRFYIQKKFTTNMYLLDCSYDCYFRYLNFKYNNFDLSKNDPSKISAVLSPSPTYFTIKNGSLFTIRPNTSSNLGNKNATSFNIYLDCSNIFHNLNNINIDASNVRTKYNAITQSFTGLDINVLSKILEWNIQNWTDPILNNKPLQNSTLSMSLDASNNPYTSFFFLTTKMDLSINTHLLAKDYDIIFTDTVNQSWNKYLFLNNSYSFKDWSFNVFNNNIPFVYKTGNNKIYGNLITLYDNKNNYFYIEPNVSGITDSTNANRVTIRIDASVNGTNYTANEIINKIQAEFDIHLYGSRIYRDSSNTYLRINHSRIYKTYDYKIVYYDPYSFARCFIGASAVQNTSWDSTLGWIIGFREITEYPLGINYVEYDVNTKDTYYLNTKSFYKYDSITNIASIVGDTTVSVNSYNYFMLNINDYALNRLNDGLVGIAPAETSVQTGSYANRGTITCDPVTGNKIFSGTTNGRNKNTTNQIYAENQKILSLVQKPKIYGVGPSVQDVFAIIPLNASNIPNGSIYTETGSGLQKNERLYFGPVNLSRMNIQLVTDRGHVVDLNGSDWSCTIQCDCLYQNKNV